MAYTIIVMGRPKGSKSKSKEGYKERTRKVKELYGDDCFVRWGNSGGNPILLKERK